jgi:protease YdgD
MARRLGVLWVLCVALAGCGISEGDVASDTLDGTGDAIQNGSADNGHPAVGMVWFTDNSYCSGSLIASDVVLTAGHCVTDSIEGFYTGKGTPTTTTDAPPANMVHHDVRDQIGYPGYVEGDCPNTTFDIGLIRLAAPVTTISPLHYATHAPPADGTLCTAVGFGDHTVGSTDQWEAKRKGTEKLVATADVYLTVTQGSALADHGDSGGPLICGTKIVGTTSCHNDGDWPQHNTEYYARVDAASAWIAGQITQWHAQP